MAFFPDIITGDSSTFLFGLISGFVVFLISFKFMGLNKKDACGETSNENAEFSFSESSGNNKMVLVVRNDLKMGKGKAAAQCSHAAVMAHELALKKSPQMLKEWKRNGQRKIVVKTESEGELLKLADDARKAGLVYAVVCDAGLTQVESGTRTVIAIGPGPQALVDKVTDFSPTAVKLAKRLESHPNSARSITGKGSKFKSSESR